MGHILQECFILWDSFLESSCDQPCTSPKHRLAKNVFFQLLTFTFSCMTDNAYTIVCSSLLHIVKTNIQLIVKAGVRSSISQYIHTLHRTTQQM